MMKEKRARKATPFVGCSAYAIVVGLLCLVCLVRPAVVHAFDPPSVFPVSVRQALAEKAKLVNGVSSSDRHSLSSYAPPGWSNRAGTALTPQHLNPGVYTADRPFMWNVIFDVGCRCTIVEIPNSSSKENGKPDLWVHSPVGLDGPTMRAIDALGTVKYVVSPNYEHVKFAPQWYQAYPDGEMWGCPGLPGRMTEIQWKGEIPSGYRPPGYKGGSAEQPDPNLPWDATLIQPLHINVEVNPFTGKPFFNEVVYYHRDSKTLIVTDLYWNYPASGVPNEEHGANDAWELAPAVESVPLTSRLWKVGMDQVFGPFYSNLMVQDKEEYKSIVDHIMNVWDIEMVVPAHGDILRGKDFVRKVLSKYFGLDQ